MATHFLTATAYTVTAAFSEAQSFRRAAYPRTIRLVPVVGPQRDALPEGHLAEGAALASQDEGYAVQVLVAQNVPVNHAVVRAQKPQPLQHICVLDPATVQDSM